MSSATGRRWWRGLSVRLNAWYVAVLVAILIAAAFGARWVMRRSIDDEQQLFISGELQRNQTSLSRGGDGSVSQAISAQATTSTQRIFVRVTNARNKTLAFDGSVSELDFAPEDLRPGDGPRVIQTIGSHPGQPWKLTQSRIGDHLWLQVGVDDSPRQALLRHAEHGFWALLAIAAVLAVVGGVWLTRRALVPVRALANTSRRIIDSGDIEARVPLSGTGDEFDELSVLFNQVLDKNQRLVTGMRESLDNVAHDLRTPLSRMHSSAELALTREDDDARLRDALADCVEESDRVLVMLRTLMDISEAETGVMHLQLAPVDVQALCRRAAELYEHVAEDRQVSLEVTGTEPVVLRVDEQRISQAIANLVDNAVKYTDPGGRVTIGARKAGGTARITVSDTGIGIEEVHLEKVWQRLYRADASRSRRGLGLGLSFVRAVVEAHGGSVHLTSKPGEGSTFDIELPAGR